MKIIDITTIASGVNVRKSKRPNAYALQVRDFISVDEVDDSLEPNIALSKNLKKHTLNSGDILVLSKGRQGFRAYFYDGSHQPAVASSAFLVLKDFISSFDPKFVQWFINLDSTQKVLNSLGRGSALPAINKSILADLDIPKVPLKTQKQIVIVDQLNQKENELIQKINNLNSKIVDYKLNSLCRR